MKTKKKFQKSSLNILSIAGLKPYFLRKDEEYMNEMQIKHFKKILETWKKEVTKVIQKNIFIMKDKHINLPDPIDRAAQEENFNLELRKRDRDYKIIKKINETLKRVESNTFGYCGICEIEIGIRRLEARPTAYLCIDCKTLAELRKKQISR
ncbi:RNA polymerase-binding protein DksA [Buchnera aphidicola]|uniref:RNA polymerase-binding protein DksA n=1 Tax=Buchnera aphidicola TaxID=9 RepID=UPI00094C85B8|nr:RNA polymerase-binding protein DksA [Buchnera aphidicola]